MEVYQPLLSVDWNLLFTVITVLVLFLILKHFFFEKVHNFMVEREASVKASLDHAEEVNRLAEKKLQNYEEKIAGAQEESRRILKGARDDAKVQAVAIVDEAEDKARVMIEHAQKEIRREQYNARKELQQEIGALAMMAAERMIDKALSAEDQSAIVDNIIEEAEEKPWN